MIPGYELPNRLTFECLHWQLRTNGSFNASRSNNGIERCRKIPAVKERSLNTIEDNPLTSSRVVGRAMDVSHITILRALHEDRMHPYQSHRMHALILNNYLSRIIFVSWYLQQTAFDQVFPAVVLFTDEVTFIRSGMFNIHNCYLWALDNPHDTIIHADQD